MLMNQKQLQEPWTADVKEPGTQTTSSIPKMKKQRKSVNFYIFLITFEFYSKVWNSYKTFKADSTVTQH